jgi:hypothetical protein
MRIIFSTPTSNMSQTPERVVGIDIKVQEDGLPITSLKLSSRFVTSHSALQCPDLVCACVRACARITANRFFFVCMLTVILCGLACAAGLRGIMWRLCVRVSGHALRRLTVAGNSVTTVRHLPPHTRLPAHPRASRSCMRRCQVAGSCRCGDVPASLLALPNLMFDHRSVMRRCVALPVRSRGRTFPSA